MRLTDFLSEAAIRAPLEARTKTDAIRELVDLLDLPDQQTREAVLAAVLEREELMSTGIGNGIAIPHGMAQVPFELKGALGISPEPFDYGSIDGKPVCMVFLIVVSEGRHSLSLKALARLSRLLHRETFRNSLCLSRSPEEAMQKIVDEEAHHRI